MLTVSSYSFFFGSVQQIKLATRQLLGARKFFYRLSCRLRLCADDTCDRQKSYISRRRC